MAEPTLEEPDFSLVLGGPVYQLFQRAHLTGPALEMLFRRIVVISMVPGSPCSCSRSRRARRWVRRTGSHS